MRPSRTLAIAAALLMTLFAGGHLAAQEYEKATRGTRILESQSGSFSIKMLVEEANLGGREVEIGEATFAAHSNPSRGHLHGTVEIFYVLSGTLVHVVNGKPYTLTPGMVGIVRPGDDVAHQVPGDEDVKALVIWAPGGEAGRIAPGVIQRPIGEPRP